MHAPVRADRPLEPALASAAFALEAAVEMIRDVATLRAAATVAEALGEGETVALQVAGVAWRERAVELGRSIAERHVAGRERLAEILALDLPPRLLLAVRRVATLRALGRGVEALVARVGSREDVETWLGWELAALGLADEVERLLPGPAGQEGLGLWRQGVDLVAPSSAPVTAVEEAGRAIGELKRTVAHRRATA